MTKRVLISLMVLFSLASAAFAEAPYPIYYPLFGRITGPEGVTLEGRTVRFWKSERTDLTEGVATAVTAANGFFVINVFDIWPDEVVIRGNYRFDVPFMEGYGIPTQEGDYFISGIGYDEMTSPPCLLALTSEVVVYASISGTVEDTAGNAIYQAGVTADTQTQTTTANDGTYSLINLAAGTYTVTASKADYYPSSEVVTVTTGETKTDVDFTLASVIAATKIQVKVTDAVLGGPIRHADVEISGEGKTQTTQTGDDGKCSFTVDPGTYQVKVSKQYYIPKTDTVTVIQGKTEQVPIPIKHSSPPEIRQLRFGERLYQPVLVAKGEKFYIPSRPKIIATLTNEPESGIASDALSIVMDAGTTASQKFEAKDMKVSAVKTQSIAGIEKISEMLVELSLSESAQLTEGVHTFTFAAENDYGLVGSFTATVEVLGGPLRIVDVPITFPSPFSPSKDKEVFIQYTLSGAANIDIYIYSIAGELIKKFSCGAGEEGGAGQLNKVKWNGIMDVGGVVGNGIYVGTIISRDDNKLLGKFKLNVFD